MVWPTLVWIALLAPPLPAPGEGSSARMEEATISGKVIELTDALRARGLSVDAGPVAKQVVVSGEDGTLTPLLCDDASRALFEDARLRDRPAELKVRRQAGLPYVQVLSFQIVSGGRLRTPEYYCEIC